MDEINKQKKFKNEVKDLLPLLKEAYTMFYGEEYRQKISDIIDSMRFLFINNHNKLCDNKEELIMINRMSTEEYNRANQELSLLGDASGCVISKVLPPIVMMRIADPLKLHDLIHEVNHALHMGERLAENKMSIGFGEFIPLPPSKQVFEGITMKKDDFVYELINEYMSMEILNDTLEICREKGIKLDNINTSFDQEKYIFLDHINGDGVKKVYEDYKDMLKKLLINAHGQNFLDVFGKDDYNQIQNTLAEIFLAYLKLLTKYSNMDIDQEKIHDLVAENLGKAFDPKQTDMIQNDRHI